MFSQVNKTYETMTELDIFMNPDKYEDEKDTDDPQTYNDLLDQNKYQEAQIKRLEKMLNDIRNVTRDHIEFQHIYKMTNHINYFDSESDEE